jgi:hypothetical protein
MLSQEQFLKIVNYPLSDTDIQKILKPSRTRIITYPELAKVSDINSVFDQLGRCIVFIPISPTFGHWCCLIKSNNNIEWFDPYSVKVDGEKKWISKATLIKLHEEKPYLTELLQKTKVENGTKLTFNPYHWQKDTEGVNDCGRWTAIRCKLYNKSLSEISDMIKKSNMTPDEWVCNVTYNILGK